MLKFSNSQSCKEFTPEGEFLPASQQPWPSRDSTPDAASPNYIDVYRCMVKHANCFTLNKSKPNPRMSSCDIRLNHES
jgi:hypothetical protein